MKNIRFNDGTTMSRITEDGFEESKHPRAENGKFGSGGGGGKKSKEDIRKEVLRERIKKASEHNKEVRQRHSKGEATTHKTHSEMEKEAIREKALRNRVKQTPKHKGETVSSAKAAKKIPASGKVGNVIVE